MSGMEQRDVEHLLRAHYRAERDAPDEAAKAETLKAVRRELDSGSTRDPTSALSFTGFIATQACFIHVRVWIVQIALVVALVVLCLYAGTTPRGFSLVSGMLAAATVLIGLPDLLASTTYRMAELEYACRFDCRSVALARCIVLGCSDVVAITALALTAPLLLEADLFASLMYVCVPYFLSCAGALLIARRCAPTQALPLACVWTLLVMAGAYAAFSFVPGAYAQASVWLWALVAVASLVWTGREVRTWLVNISRGLDVLTPDPTFR